MCVCVCFTPFSLFKGWWGRGRVQGEKSHSSNLNLPIMCPDYTSQSANEPMASPLAQRRDPIKTLTQPVKFNRSLVYPDHHGGLPRNSTRAIPEEEKNAGKNLHITTPPPFLSSPLLFSLFFPFSFSAHWPSSHYGGLKRSCRLWRGADKSALKSWRRCCRGL